MRKYYPIWKALKESASHICEIAAPIPLHRRIIKAVIAEKYTDVGYKFLLDEKNKTARLSYTVQGAKIIFRLQFYGTDVSDF